LARPHPPLVATTTIFSTLHALVLSLRVRKNSAAQTGSPRLGFPGGALAIPTPPGTSILSTKIRGAPALTLANNNSIYLGFPPAIRSLPRFVDGLRSAKRSAKARAHVNPAAAKPASGSATPAPPPIPNASLTVPHRQRQLDATQRVRALRRPVLSSTAPPLPSETTLPRFYQADILAGDSDVGSIWPHSAPRQPGPIVVIFCSNPPSTLHSLMC